MQLKTFNILLITLLLNFGTFGQSIVKKVFTNAEAGTKENVSFLVENNSVRHGNYTKLWNSTLIVEGTYANNLRTGTWNFYDRGGRLVHSVNFDDFQILESNDTTDFPFDAVLLGGYEQFNHQLSRIIKYPSQAKREGTTGVVVVTGTVTEQGDLTNLRVTKGIGSGCDEELLKAIKVVNPVFIPALTEAGEPTESEVLIGANFALL